MTRARLENALRLAAQDVARFGRPAHEAFARLEAELTALDAAEAKAAALQARAAALANQPATVGNRAA